MSSNAHNKSMHVHLEGGGKKRVLQETPRMLTRYGASDWYTGRPYTERRVHKRGEPRGRHPAFNQRKPTGAAHSQVLGNDGKTYSCAWPRYRPRKVVDAINHYAKVAQVCAFDIAVRERLPKRGTEHNRSSNANAVVSMWGLLNQLDRSIDTLFKQCLSTNVDTLTDLEQGKFEVKWRRLLNHKRQASDIRNRVDAFSFSEWVDSNKLADIARRGMVIDRIGIVVPEVAVDLVMAQTEEEFRRLIKGDGDGGSSSDDERGTDTTMNGKARKGPARKGKADKS
jgi:hypothetical protein